MLEYVALGLLTFTAVSLLFGAIAILDIPHKIALERNHPHQDAIYFAGWVSLFTLHALWPILWVWSAAYREDPVPRFAQLNEDTAVNDKAEVEAQKEELKKQLEAEKKALAEAKKREAQKKLEIEKARQKEKLEAEKEKKKKKLKDKLLEKLTD